MSDVKCPYCEATIEINHDDGQGYEEDGLHGQQCGKCEKTFTFTTSIHYSYETYKADCINDGEHKYKPTHTYPKEFTKMACTTCDATRNPTKEEMEKIING
jgi:hypothetical protein